MAAIGIHRVGDPDQDPEGFAALAAISRTVAAELDPDDQPRSDRELRYWFFEVGPDRRVVPLVAVDGGRPIGFAYAMTVSHAEDDLQLSIVEMAVDADRRRRGVGTALLRTMVPLLEELGQNSVIADVCDQHHPEAAEALCARLGLTERGADRTSRVAVADIDRTLMARWIEEAATGAAGYRLERWEGPAPDHLAERWVEAMAAMEDEPRDDADYNPYTRSADEQREADEARSAIGLRLHRTLAIGPAGDAAGLSELRVHVDRPRFGSQADTAVVEAHRGHGLGRWMKAANLDRVLASHPDLERIETSTAESNPWMLAINDAMGFRPHHRYRSFQGPLAGVRAALAG